MTESSIPLQGIVINEKSIKFANKKYKIYPHGFKKIMVIGSVGNGKSSLANRIVEKKNIFTESDDADSETKLTIGYNSLFMGMPIHMIDTPGLNDSDGMDSKHLKELILYLQKCKDIHAILLVFNSQSVRFDKNIKRLVRLITTLFNTQDFWCHVGIVFTKVYSGIQCNKEKKRTQYNEYINKIISETGITTKINIPSYFVDSHDFEDPNTLSELKYLNTWISTKDPILTDKLKEPDIKYMKTINVEKKKLVDTKTSQSKTPIMATKRKSGMAGMFGWKKSYISGYTTNTTYAYTYVIETRNEYTLYDNKSVIFSDWKTIKTYITNSKEKEYVKKLEKLW